MLRSYKYRMYPTEEQELLINKTIGCARFIYNNIRADYEQQIVKNVEKPKFITPAKFKTKYKWLREVDSIALCNAQLHVQSAYRKFWKEIFPKIKNKRKLDKKYKKSAINKWKKNNLYQFKLEDMLGYPNFHSKRKSRQSYTTNAVGNNIRIEDGKLRLPKLGLVDVVFHRYCRGKIKSVTISKKCNKYYVSILTEQEAPQVKPVTQEKILGIDMSFSNFAVYSDGTKAKFPRFYRKQEKHITKLSRKLSKKKQDSKNWEKAKLKLALAQEKIANQRKDFIYNEIKKILQNYNIIIVEDINLQSMSKCFHNGKSVHDLGFGYFRTFLEYKLKEIDGKLIKADRFYPSSQLCSNCGTKHPQVKDLSLREWTCPKCGIKHDRDINAAINLKNYYTIATMEINDCGDDVRPEVAIVDEAIKVASQELASLHFTCE